MIPVHLPNIQPIGYLVEGIPAASENGYSIAVLGIIEQSDCLLIR